MDAASSNIARGTMPLGTAEWRPGEFALRDAWFPVVHSPTLGSAPLLRTIHSQSCFLWRDTDGVHAADHHPGAPRRAAPNGLTDGAGRFVAVERFGHVWLWYGDPARADERHLPDIPFLPIARPQPAYSWGVNFFHCTYELVLENILDLTHIDFVHGNYSGSSDADEDSISFESTSETVTMIRTIRNKPTSAYQRDVLGVTAKRQDQKAFTHVFIRSGVCFLHSHYSAAPSIPLMQSNTPESKTLTRANYVFGIQQTTNKAYARAWPRTASLIADQDEAVLNPQNPRYLGQASAPDCSTRFDAAALHFRRRYNALVERQRGGDFAYAPDAAGGSDLAEILNVRRMGARSNQSSH